MDKLDVNQYRQNLIEALDQLKANRVEESRDILEILLTQARHPTVLTNLAGIYMMEERWILAKPLLLESIQQTPSADSLANLALCELMQYEPAIALEHAEQAIDLDSTHLNALTIAAKALNQMQSAAAAEMINEALKWHPDQEDLLLEKAKYTAQHESIQGALQLCDQILEIKPEKIEAKDLRKVLSRQIQDVENERDRTVEEAEQLNEEAIQLRRANRANEALTRIVEALNLKPDSPELLSNAGQILTDLGQFEFAIMHYHQSLQYAPDDPDTLNNLGNTLNRLNDQESARMAYEAALESAPEHAPALINLATMARLSKDFEKSRALYDRAIQTGHASADLFYGRGCLSEVEEKFQEAIQDFSVALDHQTDHSGALGRNLYLHQQLCRWTHIPKFITEIEKLLLSLESQNQGSEIPPHPLLAVTTDNTFISLANKLYVQGRFSQTPLPESERISAAPSDIKRIGYLSSDFFEHATMRLFRDALLNHDFNTYEIHLISYTRDALDSSIQELQTKGAILHDVSELTDLAAAQLIKSLDLDILIDLKGSTRDNRLGILSFRPCETQGTFLGYPGPINSPAVDFVIADHITLPKSDQRFFREKIVHLSRCYQANPPVKPNNQITSIETERKKWGLPSDRFVFASFNQQYKVTEEVADTWLTILTLASDSILWFYSTEFEAYENFKQKAKTYGLDSARILHAEICPFDAHMRRIQAVDLCLDTFPCNGHTTTSDCLRNSVPVITTQGKTFAGRVSESLLNELDLNELVTTSPLQYIQLAVRFANDESFSNRIKEKLDPKLLSENRLFKPELFIQDFEACIAKLIGD